MQSYTINSRAHTLVDTLSKDIHFEKDKNYLFELSSLSLVHLLGEKSATFLQGQVTADVMSLTNSKVLPAALCNLKGRIMSLLDIIAWRGISIIASKDMESNLRLALEKVAMFSRVQLHTIEDIAIYGFYCQDPKALLPVDEKFQIDNACSYVLIEKSKKQAFIAPFLEQKTLKGSLAWHTLQLSHQKIHLYPETEGLFLPHRLDLHKTEAISFTKGCYKGQEIIARTQYLAKTKYEMCFFTIQTEEALRSGLNIYDANTQSVIGELIDYAPLSPNTFIIATSMLIERPSLYQIEGHTKPVLLIK